MTDVMTEQSTTPAGDDDDDDLDPSIHPRFRRLHRFLLAREERTLFLSFAELSQLIDGGLPPTMIERPGQWWSNNPTRSYAKSWLLAGWAVRLMKEAAGCEFLRDGYQPPSLGRYAELRSKRERYAWNALQSDPQKQDLDREWWAPHLVFIVHHRSLGLYRVGITGRGTRRIANLCANQRGELVQVEQFANRFAATFVECDVLLATDDWRFPIEASLLEGRSNIWDDSGPVPSIVHISEVIQNRLNPPLWNTTAQGLPDRGPIDDSQAIER